MEDDCSGCWTSTAAAVVGALLALEAGCSEAGVDSGASWDVDVGAPLDIVGPSYVKTPDDLRESRSAFIPAGSCNAKN